MKRFIDHHLLEWKTSSIRKPLLLHGARQVGKTFAVRKLGQSFENMIEINLENTPELATIFEKTLQPQEILHFISLATLQTITPGKTLLFFDEIQNAPRSVLALRYFYELMPELHVIAAGSLLDFTIQEVGVPVGRVMSMYMFPMSFLEFLLAQDGQILVDEILQHEPNDSLIEPVHKKLLAQVGEYIAIGGMPEVVKNWCEKRDYFECAKLQNQLIDFYQKDFRKYAKKLQIKYLNLLFQHVPQRLGKKFKYSEVSAEYRKRELEPSLDLLVTAGVVDKVTWTAAQGIPLGAQVDLDNFKTIFLDCALSQAVLGLDMRPWMLNPLEQFINKGDLIEAFVGQELLAYANPYRKAPLFYWARAQRGSEAEVDYVIQCEDKVIPIEVKSGEGKTLKSMHMFLESHQASPCGIKISTQNYSQFEKIKSYPLYAVAKVVKDCSSNIFEGPTKA